MRADALDLCHTAVVSLVTVIISPTVYMVDSI